MFLEQFVKTSLQKRYVKEILLKHFIYIPYLQSKHRLDTNVKNNIVTSNKRCMEVKNENSSYICKIFKW